MKRNNPIFLLLILSLTLSVGLSSCAYQHVVNKGTPEEKLAAAKKYYKKQDYNRALPLFDGLIGTYFRGKDAEEIYYYYTYTHYGMRDFFMAGYHFKTFTATYPNSEKTEEAAFMVAKCEYHKTLPYQLDQSATRRAIDQIQLFINKYPKSTYVEEGNDLIDELRGKLHKKAYETAILYYNMENYKSSYVSCKNAIIDYPDIPQYAELEFVIIESAYKYAAQSLVSLQPERYAVAIEDGTEYLNSHSEKDNAYFKKVKELVESAKVELEYAEVKSAYNSYQVNEVVKKKIEFLEEALEEGEDFLKKFDASVKHHKDVKRIVEEATNRLKNFSGNN